MHLSKLIFQVQDKKRFLFSNITIDPKQGTISGKTAPNATILVSRADDARVILASFTADAQGNFTASNLVPGTKIA